MGGTGFLSGGIKCKHLDLSDLGKPPVAAEVYTGEEEEKLQKMYTCIQKLEEKEKMITLLMLEGTSYPEIAEVVGISEETLRVRIHRIKKNLTLCVQHGNI
jgi:RNA polymerase sigma factor (sigma-70 family)